MISWSISPLGVICTSDAMMMGSNLAGKALEGEKVEDPTALLVVDGGIVEEPSHPVAPINMIAF